MSRLEKRSTVPLEGAQKTFHSNDLQMEKQSVFRSRPREGSSGSDSSDGTDYSGSTANFSSPENK
jgi:hypothetical protein